MGTNMSQYKHRITLIVPENYIDHANQLALIMGESSVDTRTFTIADWRDLNGNVYAVCSTVCKPVVVNALHGGLPSPLPNHASDADVSKAQQALDMIVQYDVGVKVSQNHIVLAIDYEPHKVFDAVGLLIANNDELADESFN